MNGTSASTATTATFIRVYRVTVDTVGVYGNTNAGNITINAVTGGTVQAHVPFLDGFGFGQTQGTHYTIPRGHTGYVLDMLATVDTNKSVSFRIQIREAAGNTTTPRPWKTIFHADGLEGANALNPHAPLMLPEKTDIKATAVVASGSAKASFNYQILLSHLGTGD